MRSCKFRRLLSGSGVMKSPWPGSEPRQNLCVLVLIGTLIRWKLSVRKRAKAMVDVIKLTNLLDEAKCYKVIRQLRWPDGVVCLHCRGTEVVRNGHDDRERHRQ